MSTETELLLTDEYVQFSQKIAAIHEERKSKAAEFKKLYDQYQAEQDELEKKAESLCQAWEDWKSKQLGKDSENEQE